jgi:radical SAM protein with 4Fe4S-binding SPASM domain
VITIKNGNKIKENLPYIPKNVLFQWHVTERCNLRCNHCYQESYKKNELSYDQLVEIFNQFLELIEFWKENLGRSIKSHITITGGEPFFRKDFDDILKLLSHHRDKISFGILSNGYFIDKEKASYLKNAGTSFIQISIEGSKNTHNQIRGKKSYERAVQAIKNLANENIYSMISFTAHRNNFKEFPLVAELGRKLEVSRVWSDRLIPSGSGYNLIKDMLSVEETQEYFKIMKKEKEISSKKKYKNHEIVMHRALQFLEGWGKPYQCSAGDSLITVQANGDLLPCRRMPIPVGNLLKTKLMDLYYASDLFSQLRDRNRVSNGCEGCFYSKVCRGGLKCLSFALTGNPFNADPQCWLAPEKGHLNNIEISQMNQKELELDENQKEIFIQL